MPQAKVAAKTAEHFAETRWWHQRVWEHVQHRDKMRTWLIDLMPDTLAGVRACPPVWGREGVQVEEEGGQNCGADGSLPCPSI